MKVSIFYRTPAIMCSLRLNLLRVPSLYTAAESSKLSSSAECIRIIQYGGLRYISNCREFWISGKWSFIMPRTNRKKALLATDPPESPKAIRNPPKKLPWGLTLSGKSGTRLPVTCPFKGEQANSDPLGSK